MSVIPQQYPLWCAYVEGRWIKSGRVVGWEYQPDQDGPGMLKPIIAWVAGNCFEGGGDPAEDYLYIAEDQHEVERLAMRGPKGD
jgi:hypothetical protein